MADRRWLLVLGSNADDAAARLDAAIAAFGDAVQGCSARIDGDDVSGRGPRYWNQLIELDAGEDLDALRAACKRIEHAHGRGEGDERVCALDIDVLARIDAGLPCLVDDKPLRIPAVRTLLAAFERGLDR